MSWNVETRVSESRVKLIGLETNENSSRIRKKKTKQYPADVVIS